MLYLFRYTGSSGEQRSRGKTGCSRNYRKFLYCLRRFSGDFFKQSCTELGENVESDTKCAVLLIRPGSRRSILFQIAGYNCNIWVQRDNGSALENVIPHRALCTISVTWFKSYWKHWMWKKSLWLLFSFVRLRYHTRVDYSKKKKRVNTFLVVKIISLEQDTATCCLLVWCMECFFLLSTKLKTSLNNPALIDENRCLYVCLFGRDLALYVNS